MYNQHTCAGSRKKYVTCCKTTAFSVMRLFGKCVSLLHPQKANVDYIKNNHPVSSLPLLSRVIGKAIIIKLQNIDVFFSSASLLT